MKIKKKLIATGILLSISGAVSANYNVIISKEKNTYDSGKISVPVYSEWVDVGAEYNCVERYSPFDYNLDEEFTQIADCSQNQERTVTVTELVDGERRDNVTKETQTIGTTKSYQDFGEKNYKTGEERIDFGQWSDSGVNYDCKIWTPDTSTVDYGTTFTQTRECNQDQTRTNDIYDIWADGTESFSKTETESQTIKETESQSATGIKNFKASERADDWSSWSNTGIHYDCSSWVLDVSEVDYGTTFTQTRECDQNQERTRSVYDVWADGSETFNRIETATQIIKETESQSATGTKNFKTGEERIEYGEWQDEGNHYNCQTWLPLVTDVYTGTDYTQTRNCNQDQTRVKDTYDIWADGSEEHMLTENESQIITEIESQAATGTLLAQSCKKILDGLGSVGSGLYTIYIDSNPKQVNCDMTTDGGGWTIVADQNLYVEGYPTANSGIPDDNPNNTQNTRFTRWPKYTEYAVKSVYDLHGAPYDTSVAPEFRKFNTGSFGEVEVDMISFLLNKNDYQNGRAKDAYVTYNGVPWGDSNSHASYQGYYWFGKSGMTYNHWGQADIWGHIVNSDLFRIASTEIGYARTAGCGAAWANNSCRLAKTAWVNRGTIKHKAVLMVR